MATSFPTGLDAFTNPTSSDYLDTAGVLHDEQHANVNDAVEALQAKVGVNGSAVTSSHDYKLAVANTWSGLIVASNLKRGTGSPEGAVTGNVGDLYARTDGAASTVLYVKESGTGNTGWRAIADDIPKSLLTTKGDLIGRSSSAVARLAVGANNTALVAASAETLGVKWATLKVPFVVTWRPMGEVKVPSGDTDYLGGFYLPADATITACRHQITSGTSATVKVQKNGSDLTGFTSISVTTTDTTTNPTDQAASAYDKIDLVVTAVSGTPNNMEFSLFGTMDVVVS